MAMKTYKPTSPARRQMTNVDYSCLSKDAPERSLLTSKKKHSGRNSYGRITVRHRGGVAAFEVDNSVLLAVAAATMAYGNAAITVTTCIFL